MITFTWCHMDLSFMKLYFPVIQQDNVENDEIEK